VQPLVMRSNRLVSSHAGKRRIGRWPKRAGIGRRATLHHVTMTSHPFVPE
jgi:hypothetical protein